MAKTPPLVLALAAGESIDAHAIKVPPAGRITLSTEAREILARTGLLNLEGPHDPAWPDLEDALLEVLMPVRYITGVPTSRQLREDTQANEVHGLTPLPLHEQRPGAWNFKEPRP